MWKLTNVKKEHIEKFLSVGEEFTVGRKDANLLITNDPSVSRKHATLHVKHPEENVGNPNKRSSLFLRDEGSKYGTFKNGVRVSSETELNNKDIVKFGQFESEYKICYIPVVVTTSCLDVFGKKELKKTVFSLGGHFVSEWQPSCTHLVMSEVKVTIKALCCLCSAKPIVKPDYFKDLKNSIKASSIFILPNKYIPPIGEALIDKEKVSFDINLDRKDLFKQKTFLFLDEKQFKKLHLGIVLGGGNASILSPDSVSSNNLLEKGCCIIEPTQGPSQGDVANLQEVKAILQSKKLRMIPESDVGLAVAYCSTEKFCNPEFNMGDIVLQSQKLQSQTLTEREVYVPDTQERLIRAENAKKVTEAFESLNFSSFHAGEGMEISEIPLSAQLKRELADIFDEPMEEDIAVIQPMKSVNLSVSENLERTRKLKTESSPELHRKEFINQNATRSSTRIKRESPSTNVTTELQSKQTARNNSSNNKRAIKLEEHCNDDVKVKLANGNLNEISEVCDDQLRNGLHEPELPRNLMKIEVVSLICKKSNQTPPVQTYKNSSVKNFKKFKKVYPKTAHTLPKIIGAHELVPYDRIAAEICNQDWDDYAEEAPQPIKGAFDWDTPTV